MTGKVVMNDGDRGSEADGGGDSNGGEVMNDSGGGVIVIARGT